MVLRPALLAVLSMVLSASTSAATRLGFGAPLHTRATATSVVCLQNGEFEWMDNSEGMSPCEVAALINGVCGTGNFTVVPINGSIHYLPSPQQANPCSCSWASYNLLSACATCQGFPQAIGNWAEFKDPAVCGSQLTNTYYPPYVLPTNVTIPFWAAKQPDSWQDARFNPDEAEGIAREKHSDVGSTLQTKSKSPVGAIVGGVVGGVAGLVLAALATCLIVRWRRRERRPETATAEAPPIAHGRSGSDISQKSTGIGLGYSRLPASHQSIYYSPSSPTLRTGSIRSFSQLGSIDGSMALAPTSLGSHVPARVISPAPTLQMMNRENIIMPFTLQPPSQQDVRVASGGNERDQHRKATDGAVFPVYDPPTLPPASIIVSSTDNSPRRNPPAYSPYVPSPSSDAGSQTPARVPTPTPKNRPKYPHEKQGSTDTQHSWDTSLGVQSRHEGGGSISAIDDVVGRMGINMSVTASGSGRGNTVGTGQSENIAVPHGIVNPDESVTTRHDNNVA